MAQTPQLTVGAVCVFRVYFDDIWKITSKVTLNLRLRYQLTPPWEDQTGILFNGIVRLDARTTLAAPNVPDRALYPFFLRQGAPRQSLLRPDMRR